MNYKIVRNQLGEYGVVRVSDNCLMGAFSTAYSFRQWTTDKARAERALLEYEQKAEKEKKRNTWEAVK